MLTGRARQIFTYQNKGTVLFPGKGSAAKKKLRREGFKTELEEYRSSRREHTESFPWLLPLCPTVRMVPVKPHTQFQPFHACVVAQTVRSSWH